MAAWMLHGLCFGEEAGARNLVFFRVKWLQATMMKGTSCVRRVRLRSFRTRLVPSMCFATSGCSCVRSSMRFLKLWLQIALWMAAWMLHGLCFGEEAGARNRAFFRVKWLQATMKGTSCVRRVPAAVVPTRLVPSIGFATSGCSCVRSSMRFLKLWLQIALEWLHECCMGYVLGGSRSTKPCIFPCKVAAGDDERYLVCAMGAAAVVPDAIGSFYVFCNKWLFLCA